MATTSQAVLGHPPKKIKTEELGSEGATAGRTCVLAVALGGGSDCIGALALAKALGYEDVVLVQPGSGSSGSSIACEPVSAIPTVPGGHFHANATMLAYLLSLPAELRPTAASFLRQPKDAVGGQGFTRSAIAATASALVGLAREHACTAVLGLDFGGDVVLPEPTRLPSKSPTAERPCVAPLAAADALAITQRDTLNLHALAAVARTLGVAATLVASAPGVDAAAVAPEYAQRLGAAGGATVRVLAMGADATRPCALAPLPAPAPVCRLPLLPASLSGARLPTDLEEKFISELRRLAARISSDATDEVRREHAYKTYALVAACAAALDGASSAAERDFFVLGADRPAEKARAHMHASFALGLFDVAGWAEP